MPCPATHLHAGPTTAPDYIPPAITRRGDHAWIDDDDVRDNILLAQYVLVLLQGTTVHSIYATRTSSQSAVMGIDGTQAGIGSLMQMEKTISVLLFFPICHLIAY